MNAFLRTITLLIPFLVLPAMTGFAAGGAGGFGVDARVDNKLVVHLTMSADFEAFKTSFLLNNPDVESIVETDSLPSRKMHLLEIGLPPKYDEILIQQIKDDLELNYAGVLISGEFLYLNQAPEGKTGSIFVDGISPGFFDQQYSRSLLGLAGAHARSTGLGTVVAVLDTGVDATHPRLAGRVLPGYDFIDGDADPADAGNDVDDDEDTMTDEMTGHGTFVAGLITLIAPDTRILPVRVLDSDGGGNGWILTLGIAYAIDHGVEVINMSLGSTYNTATVEWLLDEDSPLEAAANGIVVVSAAGNLNRNDPREFPAMGQGIGVAGTDHVDVKADFSNFHQKLSLSAPGATADGPIDPATAIISIVPGGGYAVWEGTSFAVPLVAGTAALIRSQNPTWSADLGTSLIIQNILETSAVDIYASNPEYADSEELGAGRLDTAAAVAQSPVAPTTLGDLNNDGQVAFEDLLSLLNAWNLVHSSADLDGNGIVAFGDLLILLANWS